MDFVYICREGSNNELRYSLRTIFKNTPLNSVWVVGGRPNWYTGNYIPVPQNEDKYANGRKNLKTILDSPEIPDKFILMNDDFYITSPIDRLTVYHGGSFENKVARFQSYRRTGVYTKVLNETLNILKNSGVRNPLDYSLHLPMTIHKENFEFALSLGGSIRTIYGNMNRIGGRQLPVDDVKVHLKDIGYPVSFDYHNNEFDIPFLSTSDQTFRFVYKDVLRQYRDASPWEGRF